VREDVSVTLKKKHTGPYSETTGEKQVIGRIDIGEGISIEGSYTDLKGISR